MSSAAEFRDLLLGAPSLDTLFVQHISELNVDSPLTHTTIVRPQDIDKEGLASAVSCIQAVGKSLRHLSVYRKMNRSLRSGNQPDSLPPALVEAIIVAKWSQLSTLEAHLVKQMTADVSLLPRLLASAPHLQKVDCVAESTRDIIVEKTATADVLKEPAFINQGDPLFLPKLRQLDPLFLPKLRQLAIPHACANITDHLHAPELAVVQVLDKFHRILSR